MRWEGDFWLCPCNGKQHPYSHRKCYSCHVARPCCKLLGQVASCQVKISSCQQVRKLPGQVSSFLQVNLSYQVEKLPAMGGTGDHELSSRFFISDCSYFVINSQGKQMYCPHFEGGDPFNCTPLPSTLYPNWGSGIQLMVVTPVKIEVVRIGLRGSG